MLMQFEHTPKPDQLVIDLLRRMITIVAVYPPLAYKADGIIGVAPRPAG
jgi:hypothetical protein